MRSKLFVPGARPELFAKALASEADAISFDLEDSVPAEGKIAARAHVAEFLRSDIARASAKRLIVRVNGLDTPFGHDDCKALTNGAAHMINLPKVDSVEDVEAMASVTDLPLLLTIETPRGLRVATDLATASPQVAGLQVGLNDLCAPLGIARADREHIHAALWQIRLAAGEARCFAYDGAWPDIADEEGFCAEAALAESLGFLGKSCIHPRQVALANAMFGAADNEVDAARRLLRAAEAAAARGHGAFAFEGRMVDRPAIDRARAAITAAGKR
ncbi:HpcH/HpaI aldolase/citrate lyase family protein [Sphingopyxis sp. FD7]|uniref:HpcH/HpaI aldolase/citrate lyase family protein n=1 Tax=Sphingopyxis sp. FD7 TaxID=1914525 RepID=UPI000DC625E6|nr:CoA ester lyase [Sphingopyxis sp. FD7]BBB14320.1 L-lactate dehydrogenaseCitrate lyase [Sphingopyxis sp. FD7]